MVALALQPVESRLVAGRDLALLGRAEPRAASAHGGRRRRSSRPRRTPASPARPRRRGSRAGRRRRAPGRPRRARRGRRGEGAPGRAAPALARPPPPAAADPPRSRSRMPRRWDGAPSRATDLGDAGVPPVAHAVDEPRLGEDPRQLRRGRDREGAHLHQRRLSGLGRRGAAAGRRTAFRDAWTDVTCSSSPRTSRPLPRSGRENDLVEPAHPRLHTTTPRAQAPAQAIGGDARASDHPHRHQGPRADPNPVPPVGPQLAAGTPRSWPARRPRRRGPSGCSGSGTRSAPRESGSGGRAGATARSSRCGRCPL